MSRKVIAVYLFLFQSLAFAVTAQVQPPQVPSRMEFAGIELKIDDDAKKLIQASVLSLTRNQRYFQSKVERANIHFPIIERILNEEGVPDDFKYLVLQESELVPDAVSSSNAVGYWQFKKEAASDMNVLVNSEVDERMHIVKATRGAVRYLKKNNIYLSNWISALLSYNLGLGGVKLVVDQSDINATSMKIKGTTHIYILKFLAHKISFENALKLTPPQLTLLEYKNCRSKTLKDIAEELDVLEQDLIKYNLWLKTRKIPEDDRHSVVVPANESNYERLLAKVGVKGDDVYAVKESDPRPAVFTKITLANNLKAILAGNAETIESLAKKGGISKARFLKYNELEKSDKIIAGQIYYLQTKKNKADNDYYVAEENESYWSISQKLGIKKSRLLRFNRIAKNEKLQTGRVLWIAETRPIIVPVEVKVPAKYIAKPDASVASYPEKKEDAKISPEKSNVHEMFPDEFYDEKEDVTPVATVSSVSENETHASLNKTHVVTKGETFYSISKLYGVQIADLKKWNNLKDETPLKISQTLVIKPTENDGDDKETTKRTNYITYTVKTGDSIYKIAKDHKVTIKQLQEWNNKKDYNISIGEEIKILRN